MIVLPNMRPCFYASGFWIRDRMNPHLRYGQAIPGRTTGAAQALSTRAIHPPSVIRRTSE